MLATETPIHPAAELFPMLDFADLNQLADDIRKNGLIEPIILHGGQVLDGRNRLKACEIADVEPQFVELDDVASPVLYVLSRNLHRRHLTVSQRAAIAAEMMPLLQEEARERQESSQAQPGEQIGDTSCRNRQHLEDVVGNARDIAANAVGVGHTVVQQAVKVKRDAPEIFEKVKRGEISVNAAANGHTEQPQKGGDIAGAGTKKHQQSAESHKQRMISGISTVNGICIGLDSLDVDKVSTACDATEIREWAEKSRELANKLRKFATRLEKAQ